MTGFGQLSEVRRTQVLTDGPAEGLAHLLDIDMPDPVYLPPLWHWVHLLERPAQAGLGPDGHPLAGIPAPPSLGMRRMFAGGAVASHGRLRLGEPATRATWLGATTTKQGRAGPLTFATVRHDISQGGVVVVTERQDIVYLPATGQLTPTSATPAQHDTPGDAHDVLRVIADETLLFRFSALTYNAHRIHYDREYALGEGYDGLVVHGPLQALLMAEAFRRKRIDLVGSDFRYRLVAPLFAGQTIIARVREGQRTEAEIRDAGGQLTATASLGA